MSATEGNAELGVGTQSACLRQLCRHRNRDVPPMINFKQRRTAEREEVSRSLRKQATPGPANPTSSTTQTQGARESASGLIRKTVIPAAKPACTAAALDAIHLRHRLIRDVCRHVDKKVSAIDPNANRPAALRAIGKKMKTWPSKLSTIETFDKDMWAPLDQAAKSHDPKHLLREMLLLARNLAKLPPAESDSTDTVDAVSRLLLRASVLAEKTALDQTSSSPGWLSLKRDERIDRVDSLLKNYNYKVTASEDFRGHMEAHRRALLASRQGTRKQTCVVLTEMADLLRSDDSLTP